MFMNDEIIGTLGIEFLKTLSTEAKKIERHKRTQYNDEKTRSVYTKKKNGRRRTVIIIEEE